MVLKKNSLSSVAGPIKSPFGDIVPPVNLTIAEFVRAELVKYYEGNNIALECLDTGVKYTHKNVVDMSQGLAAGLIKSGIRRKDVIAIMLPNVPEYAAVLLGIWDAGCICTTINTAFTKVEIKWQLENSGALYIVTNPALEPLLNEIKSKYIPTLKIIVIGTPGIGESLAFFDLIETDTTGVEFLKGSEIDTTEEIAILPYSSGTTGLPKGVMLTHYNICSNLIQVSTKGVLVMNKCGTGPEGPSAERLIGILPYFHSLGIELCFVGLQYGAHAVTMSKFELSKFLTIVRAHRPTVLHVVPPLITLFVKNPLVMQDDFNSVKSIFTAAAPAGSTLINQLLDKAGKSMYFYQEGYGMTEMSPYTHCLNPEMFSCRSKFGSIGVLAPSTTAKVISTDGSARPLGPNERGELCVKGPQMMKGYLNNEEATRSTIDDEGWLHTGDIVYYDTDGCFFVVDRFKELIKVKGEQVATSELENILLEHPLILDAAVIGIPSEYAGQLPRAYIVRKCEASDLSEDEVKEYIKTRLAHFKQLKGGVEFVDSIPKSSTGKILKRVLRAEYDQKLHLRETLEKGTIEDKKAESCDVSINEKLENISISVSIDAMKLG